MHKMIKSNFTVSVDSYPFYLLSLSTITKQDVPLYPAAAID